MNNRYICTCGCPISGRGLKRHLQTKKHAKRLETAIKFPNKDELNELMSKLFDNIDKYSDGEYLRRCNSYKIWFEILKDPRRHTDLLLDVGFGEYRTNNGRILLFTYD